MMDNQIVTITIILLITGPILLLLKWLSNLVFGPSKLPYNRKNYYITKPEKDLFFSLQEILGNDYHIFPQANLDKLIHVTKGTNQYLTHFRRMNQLSVDFVVCNKELSPLFAIELDDRTHLQAKRIKRDMFVNQIFQDANLPLLRLNHSTANNSIELSQLIQKTTQSI